MGWVKLRSTQSVDPILFDSRYWDLNEAQQKRIDEFSDLIRFAKDDRSRGMAISNREICLQAWSGWPKAEFLDDADYEYKKPDEKIG
jgi:hypothetical protein